MKAFVTPKTLFVVGNRYPANAYMLKEPHAPATQTAVPVMGTELSTPTSWDAHQNPSYFGTDEALILAPALASGQGAM